MKAATQRGCFCVVWHSEAISRAFAPKATHRAVPVQQDNSRGRIGSRRFFKAFVSRQNRRSDRAKYVEEAFLFFSLQKGVATINEKIKKQPTDCGAAKGQQNHDKNGEAFLACVFFFEQLQPQLTQPGLIRAIERSGIARNRNCLQTILRSVGCSDTQIK